NSRDLLSAIAQTQTEVTRSPAITSLTIQWACQNSVTSSRLDEDIRRPLRVVQCGRIAPPPGRSGRICTVLRRDLKLKGQAAASRAPTTTRNFARTPSRTRHRRAENSRETCPN